MKKVALTELDPRLQKQVAAAEQQIRSNPQYAVEILTGILSRNPGCIEVRRALRAAQKNLLGTKQSIFAGLTNALSAGKIAKAVETDPVSAINEAEAVLAKKPTDAVANRTLALAGTKIGFHDLAAFGYSELAANDPKNVQHFIDLANVWITAGEYDKALEAADSGLRAFPGQGDLQEVVRNASVKKTMKQGKWEDKGSYQDKLKDKDEALRLEMEARKVTDAASAADQIRELAAKIQTQPDSIDLYREIVRLFIVTGDLESAIAWLQRGRQTSLGKADSSLERQESELVIQRFEKASKQLTEAIIANPSDTASREALAKNQAALTDYRIKTSASMVERYPNDYSFRYEYGTLLLSVNRIDESIQQLQYAQRNPKFRQPALLAIGQAFAKGGKYDIAAEQLASAKSEIAVMNDLKKAVIYELGCAYEKMGKAREAFEEFKAIYMADNGFRDVAKKVNDYYESQKGPVA